MTDTERLDWLEKNPQIEIGYRGYYAEDVPWWAFRLRGPINDREYIEIASADTLREVIDAARAVITKPKKRRAAATRDADAQPPAAAGASEGRE